MGPVSKANPDIRASHRNLLGYDLTPLLILPTIAKELGLAQVLLEDESYRLDLPAFKVLGASWAAVCDANSLTNLSAAALKAKLTLYTAIDGNHGRASACMAKDLDINVRIHVPHSLDDDAKSHIEEEGAEVDVEVSKDYDQTMIATKMAAERHPDENSVLVSDTALELGEETAAQWMVDGYQTMLDELEEQVHSANVPRITHAISASWSWEFVPGHSCPFSKKLSTRPTEGPEY